MTKSALVLQSLKSETTTWSNYNSNSVEPHAGFDMETTGISVLFFSGSLNASTNAFYTTLCEIVLQKNITNK